MASATHEGDNSEKKPLSRRQRLKQVNQTQKWPQQPRIQSPEARAKAYVRASGLTTTTARIKVTQQITPDDDLHSPSVRFGRLLGNPHERTRHQAVLQLQAYLKAKCDISREDNDNDDSSSSPEDSKVGLSEMDLLKLWKGLWHTLYMCDKVPVQQELSSKLAQLIWCVAGTEEEDEFAGQAYLNEYDDDDDDEEEGSDDDDDEEDEEEDNDENGSADGDSDSDSDVVIQGIVKHAHEGDEDSSQDDDDVDEDDEQMLEAPESNNNNNSNNTAEMKHCRGAHLAALFVQTFLRTVLREWGHMDKYRIDKFYTLIRQVMHQVYRYMALRHWNLGIIQLFNDVISEEVLGKEGCNGLRYHLIDLSLHELATVAAGRSGDNPPAMPLTEATFIDCMEPYFYLAQSGGDIADDTIQHRVMENILTKFLNHYSLVSDEAVAAASAQEGEDGDDDNNSNSIDEDCFASREYPILTQVHVGTIGQFIFDLASNGESTREQYRKSLYDLHKQYARRLKLYGEKYDVNLQQQHEQELMRMQQDMLETEEDYEINDNDGDDDDDDDNDDDIPGGNIEDGSNENWNSPEPSKAKKQQDDEPKDTEETGKKGKKDRKRKKRKLEMNEETDEKVTSDLDSSMHISTSMIAGDQENDSDQEHDTKEKKKKKRKKKKARRDSEDSADKSAEEPQEEEIVISAKDVKKAKAGHQKSQQETESEEATTPPTDGSRRVKFGAVNRARSYKASMKALRTANPTTPPAAPEQSILRIKNNAKRKNRKETGLSKKKSQRKKATDYF